MIYFKACSRCGGDVEYVVAAQEHKTLTCLQCSAVICDSEHGRVVEMSK